MPDGIVGKVIASYPTQWGDIITLTATPTEGPWPRY